MWIRKNNIFNLHHSQLPVVDIFSNFYRIYYSTRNYEGKSIPMYVDFDKKLNSYKTPVELNISLGNPGFFDWSGIMPTEILTMDGGEKYLYYIGWSRRIDVPYHNNLGLAISNDNGESWIKFSDGPIFHTSHREPGYIGTVSILKQDQIFKMWYLSCREWIKVGSNMEPIYDIKYAVSYNGIDWNPTNDVCIRLKDKEGGISAARVFIDSKRKYRMLFSVRDRIEYRENPEKSYRIESAISEDGIRWERTGLEIKRYDGDSWDNIMVEYPFLIRDQGKNIMIYNGNGFGKTGMGYAIFEGEF